MGVRHCRDMARDYYDDMHDRNSSRRKRRSRPSKTLFGVIILGTLICVAVIVLWLRFSSPQENPTQVIQQPPTIEEVSPPASAIAPKEEPPAQQAQRLDTRPPSGKSVQMTSHVVRAGEDLNSIAELYHLKVQTLVSINEIRNVQAITEGTTLRIPDRDGWYYTVVEGDMLSTIVRSQNLSIGWMTLQELNNLPSEQIKVGDKLFIPDVSTSSADQMSDTAPIQFLRPASGALSVSMDQNLSGVRIRTTVGEAVSAAASGEVADTGFEADGKGRYVILSHDRGYRTSYHNLRSVEVTGGTSINQGDVIGSTSEPYLFFAIEQLGFPLDPRQFF